jgi:hypothetical protein
LAGTTRTLGGVTTHHDGRVPDEEIARQLAPVWESFADSECKHYSPLYDEICRAVARDDEVLRLASDAPLFGRQPNVLLAAVHFLLLGSDEPTGLLADAYAGRPRSVGDGAVGRAFCEFVLAHRAEVAALLETRRTNTNECGRSSLLVPALRWAADVVGEPLSLVDVGASAGLNLNLDRYRIDYGPSVGAVGPVDSPVVIGVEAEGFPPVAGGAPSIAARCGLDRAPVDLSDADDARWQLACVWPDTGRLARTKAAISLAQEHPQVVVAGDAVDDLAAVVGAQLPAEGPLCVVTTWVLAYLRRRDRVRFVDVAASLSASRPVVWISAEAPGTLDVEGMEAAPSAVTDGGTVASVLAGVVYRDGAQDGPATVLGLCHPHGSWLRWLAPSA